MLLSQCRVKKYLNLAYGAERGNGLKVPIAPVLHLGSLVLVLLVLALEIAVNRG